MEFVLLCLLALKADADKKWMKRTLLKFEALNKFEWSGGRRATRRTVNQHICSLGRTYVWHPNKQQSVTRAQRGPIQNYSWSFYIKTSSTAGERGRELREEYEMRGRGCAREMERRCGGRRRAGGALCLFMWVKKYCTISHWHNTTAHIQ